MPISGTFPMNSHKVRAPDMMASTTLGSARVEMSPSESGSPSATFLRIRRITFQNGSSADRKIILIAEGFRLHESNKASVYGSEGTDASESGGRWGI